MEEKILIVFDIDGTLTDSVKQHQKIFTEILFDVGVLSINSEFKTFKHHTDSYIAKVIYENDQKELFSEAKVIQFENGLTQKIKYESIHEINGAKKLIELLKHNPNFGICYATGSLRRAAEYKLESIGITFDRKQLVASDDIYEREKIVRKAIDNATEYYNIEKFDRIISVGDGLWDLITANNLGLEFIGIGLANKTELIENGAKIVYENLLDFISFEEHLLSK
ncbi:HAD family hydrolase [Formosa sp. PL04]|uniref:HAD family hydrolase n=1 Tax=Formosa sp. PL04 TaxID=3081755 RepID=UPI002980A760|nr:HAD hydrolase-like protein [Formosa sp. PL04]MDW5289625.1 HAD hydrolase-like protein [Formosa sp. PL04]